MSFRLTPDYYRLSISCMVARMSHKPTHSSSASSHHEKPGKYVNNSSFLGYVYCASMSNAILTIDRRRRRVYLLRRLFIRKSSMNGMLIAFFLPIVNIIALCRLALSVADRLACRALVLSALQQYAPALADTTGVRALCCSCM